MGASRSYAFIVCLLAFACKDRGNSSRPPESRQPASKLVRSCAPAHGFDSVTVRSPQADALGVGLDVFAVELGRAQAFRSGFVVPFLRLTSSGAEAGAALVGVAGGLPSVTVFDRLVGDTQPPQVAVWGDKVTVVLSEADAGGGGYRVGEWRPKTRAQPRWFGQLKARPDDSAAFDVASGPSGTAVVWDEWDKAANRGVLRLAFWPPSHSGEPRLDYATQAVGDHEGPRVLTRSGGFWLAWISIGKPADDQPGAGEFSPLRTQTRWLQLQPLDGLGQAAAGAVEVTSRSRTVSGFDLSSGHSSGALVTWSEARAHGAAGGLSVARVGLDGTVDAHPVVLDEGAGVPSLAFDPDPQGGAPHAWLSVEGIRGATRFAALAPHGIPMEPLQADPAVGTGTLMSALEGRVLVARPVGRDVELKLMRCVDRPAAVNPSLVSGTSPASSASAASPGSTSRAGPASAQPAQGPRRKTPPARSAVPLRQAL